MLRNPEKSIPVKDSRSIGTVNTTCHLTKAEMQKLRPNDVYANRDIHFVFRGGGPVNVDVDMAELLIKKYPFLYIADPETGGRTDLEDDLNEMGYHELVKLLKRYNDVARELGMEPKPATGKIIKLREWVRHFRRLSVQPKPIDEIGGDDDEI